MSERILLVDDDAVFTRVLGRALVGAGYAVATAGDVRTALEKMHDFLPGQVLLDMKLGDEAGLALIGPMLECCPSLRIIVLTAYASIPTTVEAMHLGAADYLCKPVDSDSVLRALRGETISETEEERPMSLRRLEWEHIQRLLHDNAGNVSETARQLGMHRRSLQRKLAKRPARA